MADLKEVKSRIRIKRGPKTKMLGVTLPKGTPFYNEMDNTLLISDGVTELDKHPIITTDSIHTDNWTITEDTNKKLVITPKDSTDSIVISKIENGPIHKKTTITPDYIRTDSLRLKYGDLISLDDRSIQYGISGIVTKILIFDASLIGKSTGGMVVESIGRSYVKIPHTTSGSLKINIRELNAPLLSPTMKLQFNFSWGNTNTVRNESSIEVVLESNGKFATISNNSIIDSGNTMLLKNITSALFIYWDNNRTYDASTVSNLSMAWFYAADVTYTNNNSQPSVNIYTRDEDEDYYPYLESIYLLND